MGLYEQKESLSATAANLTSLIYSDNEQLIDALAYKVGMVPKNRHDEEINQMISKSDHEAILKKMVSKNEHHKVSSRNKALTALLNATIQKNVQKENKIDALQLKIDMHKKQLAEIKQQIEANTKAEKAVKSAQ